ncbi:MAG: flagellar basal body rod protein FlgC [Novosphingobium sp. 28-62-57]|uniref:flagellar basal body rod protein FlgC n=1 Tax=unclassified Novosphingobium TaxID=2644732 RepID=UPI000BD4C927|nr:MULTISPECIES: flagellar basal body rod protein FlgC [unclassified Novosphingobium]OYW47568.1 MAG: flagellar basal body rod protein FlgC [Novosphingobium sp. 12-63-9]OYZ08799.1 MAG: flagellar basal body rod protein FlgC [Novosphingobium sp. 28-62-57]OYZ39787.1 MAG: flagellar basal body rod protein FlgC [Novosphingobium sp. 16-62-11]OZA37654.1 MAG: flagellar basal body rod protein FlgC [Novosphingobium sp. 17-62-9]
MPANSPLTLFQVTGRAMSAQLVRMNAAASNLANAGTVTATEAEAYRPLRTVFGQQLDQANGLSTVQVNGVIRSDATPIRQHDPGHPLADENGDVWAAPVDENAEMVEMLESSRQYQNVVEAMQTAKQLMLETMRMK